MLLGAEDPPVVAHPLELLALRSLFIEHLLERIAQRLEGVGAEHDQLRAGRSELEDWAVHLDGLGIAHGEIKDAGYGSGLAFRDPDNIQFELFAPPA